MWDPSLVNEDFTMCDFDNSFATKFHDQCDQCIDVFGDCHTNVYNVLCYDSDSNDYENDDLPP